MPIQQVSLWWGCFLILTIFSAHIQTAQFKHKLLLNTLGGRMPYGFRIAGKNGDDVSERVLNRLDRTIRRLKTVASRVDESLN